MIINKLLNLVTEAQVAGAVYPTSSYKGSLPKKTVKRGSKGSSVKAVQTFLNWCIKAGLKVDGICGPKTVKAIKKYQKQYGLKVDGIFGEKSKAKAKSIIAKHAPKPAPKQTSWVDKANAWAKKIADDDSWHYVTWSKDSRTHECPICHNHPKGKFHGWNCVGFAFAYWHHGGGIPCKCNCHVVANPSAAKLLTMSDKEALAYVREKIGVKDLQVIRNGGKTVPNSMKKPGDLCMVFDGKKYVHIYPYVGDGYMIDAGGWKDTSKQIAKRKATAAKVVIRYTGK